LSQRFIDLTDEIKAKIEGSQKVAKKLERLSRKQLEGKDNNLNESNGSSDSDENEPEDERNDLDYEEYYSFGSQQSQELTKVNNLFSPSDSFLSNPSCCSCSCHNHAQIKSHNTKDAFAQTLSTGDIAITKVYYQQNTKEDTN